jgi:hypothetical protein
MIGANMTKQQTELLRGNVDMLILKALALMPLDGIEVAAASSK